MKTKIYWKKSTN